MLGHDCELFRVYGNTFNHKNLHRRAIVTFEYDVIKTLLSLKLQDHGNRHRQSISNTDGEIWASSCTLTRTSFNGERVADLTLDLVKEVN